MLRYFEAHLYLSFFLSFSLYGFTEFHSHLKFHSRKRKRLFRSHQRLIREDNRQSSSLLDKNSFYDLFFSSRRNYSEYILFDILRYIRKCILFLFIFKRSFLALGLLSFPLFLQIHILVSFNIYIRPNAQTAVSTLI